MFKQKLCFDEDAGVHSLKITFHETKRKFLTKSSCSFHFPPTDLPDPVTNCTAYNATAYTMQFTCIPGNDGGIKQAYFVEVINFDVLNFFPTYAHRFCCKFNFSQVFDGKEKVFNVSSEHPTFLLRKLPSDTKLVVRVSKTFSSLIKLLRAFSLICVNFLTSTLFFSTSNHFQITPFNLQGMCKDFYQLRVKTMPAPLINYPLPHETFPIQLENPLST
jgi:hypothetical protein